MRRFRIPIPASISLDGIDVLRQKDEVRRILGYLPQEFGVYPKISAVDMLHHLAVMKGMASSAERKETVDALLQQTNLWDVRKKALSTYSGGMKQRFGIAQALLGNPRLIIVDEPTAGLDPAERNRFLNLLSSLGSDRTVILSTHIVDDVRAALPAHGHHRLRRSAAGRRARRHSRRPRRQDLVEGGRYRRRRYARSKLSSTSSPRTWLAGSTKFACIADTSPGDGFHSVDSGLEDVYFLNLSQQAKRQLLMNFSQVMPRTGRNLMALFWEFFTFELQVPLQEHLHLHVFPRCGLRFPFSA